MSNKSCEKCGRDNTYIYVGYALNNQIVCSLCYHTTIAKAETDSALDTIEYQFNKLAHNVLSYEEDIEYEFNEKFRGLKEFLTELYKSEE